MSTMDIEGPHLSADSQHHPLNPLDIGVMLRRFRDNCLRGYALARFLSSQDPGAHMLEARRRQLIERTVRAADAHYMEDQWPDVGTGTLAYPDNRLLPAFSKMHWEVTEARTTVIDLIAEEAGANAWRNLSILAVPLRTELDHLKQQLGQLDQLGVALHPASVGRAERQLQWVDIRPAVSGSADCVIAHEVDKLDFLCGTVQRTTKAVKALRSALTGYKSVHGETPFFNAENHPAYYHQWLRAVKCVEKEDWATFSAQVKGLRAERSRLLAQLPRPTSSEC
ncbi:hypothetical protein CDN98_00400 [Roseateles terrae]|nr:hypothetical protein CDN98_00400 [Roseateles terrae]